MSNCFKINGNIFLPNTFGVEIHSLVQPLASEKVIQKHFPNSFRETELLSYLQACSIQQLVIIGMMTHMPHVY
jgi:nicotinamidase-related amidase